MYSDFNRIVFLVMREYAMIKWSMWEIPKQ